MIKTIPIETHSQGLYDITAPLKRTLKDMVAMAAGPANEGLCTLYIQHTSASLLVQENYDPSAKRDLEHWLNRLVPENDPLYTHTLEGADDMPAHIKASLTATSLSIPVDNGELLLGTWQGVYLWEHRTAAQQRKVIVHLMLG